MEYHVWKRITVGTYKSISEIRKAVEVGGFRIDYPSNDILNKIPITSEEAVIELVTATGTELGFKEGVCYEEIAKRIQGLGFGLCPAEIGPYLRLQFPEQKRGEWIVIAMDQILDSGGQLMRFYVTADHNGLWLNGIHVNPEGRWSPTFRWAFMRPNQ